MLQSAMGYLAAADATAMAAEKQARCLRVLEQAHSAGHRGADLDPGRVRLRARATARTPSTARGPG